MMIVMADGGTTQVIEERRLLTPRAPLTLPNLKASTKWRYGEGKFIPWLRYEGVEVQMRARVL